MRISVAFGFSLSLIACADPPRARQITDVPPVPMYTATEWTAMNSECTVPEIPANARLLPIGSFGGHLGHGHSR